MSNPWLERRILAFAHQGGAWEAPSSTLAAVEHALVCGANVIELDLHASSDGVLFVGHDAVVESTTQGSGRIDSMVADELERLDAAYWFVPGEGAVAGAAPERCALRGLAADDERYRPLRLERLLERFPEAALNLDIKEQGEAGAAIATSLAALLHEHGRVDELIVTSFFDEVTECFRASAPGVATSAGTNALVAFVQAVRGGFQPDPAIRRHQALQVPLCWAGVRVTDAGLVEAAHRAGLALHVWTVDEEAVMEELVEFDVDGIMSDRPRLLGEVLQRLGVAYASREA